MIKVKKFGDRGKEEKVRRVGSSPLLLDDSTFAFGTFMFFCLSFNEPVGGFSQV